MATIRRKGGGWQAIIRRKGFPSLYETFPLKKQAESWAAQRESEIVHGKLGILPQHTLGEALKEYREKKARNRWETNRLLQLERDPIAKIGLSRLDSAALSGLRDRELARGVQGTTVRRAVSLLASVFKACREWKWLAHNPFLDFERPPPKKGRRRGIRQHEIDAIVAALGFQEAPATTLAQQTAVEFLIALETAMRDGELLSQDWPQVGEKVVHLDKTKNGDERDVALSVRARQLYGYLRGLDPVRVFTVEAATRDTLFREARKSAGLSGFTFHDSRGEAITRLSKKIDILELADMVGHRDLNSLRHYYRSSPAEIADKL